MKKKAFMGYNAPEIEVNEVEVENGIASTGNLENPEYDEDI